MAIINVNITQRQKDILVVTSAILLGLILYVLPYDLSIVNWATGSEGKEAPSIYLLGFIVTLIGNGSVLLPIPYAAAIPILSMYLPTPSHQIILGLVCGIAAGVGEMTAYSVGYMSRKTLSEESKENLEYMQERTGGSNPVMLFLVGVLPVPDEFVVVPLAAAGYPLRKMVIFSALGKTLLCIFLSLGVGPILGIALAQSGSSALLSSVLAVAFVLLFYIFIRIDWKKIF